MTATMTRAESRVGEVLQPTLVELTDLALQAKQAHWMVVGPHFRSLHVELDEMADAYRSWIDQVAERMTALGLEPDGRTATVASTTPFPELPTGSIEDRQVLSLFVDRLSPLADRLRERVASLEGLDLATQDLLLDIQRGIEEQLWMLRAQLA